MIVNLYDDVPLYEKNIIYEDDKLIIFNKPAKIPVHPGGRYQKNSVVQFLEKKLGFRPILAYRLDREASGLLVLVKNPIFLKEIKVDKKKYFVVIKGFLNNDLIINKPIAESKGKFLSWKKIVIDDNKPLNNYLNNSLKKSFNNSFGNSVKNKNYIKPKPSITIVKPKKHFFLNKKPYSLLEIELKTGRQHQIRTHLAHIGHPVYFDKIYDEEFYFYRYLYGDNIGFLRLHLYSIEVNNKVFFSSLPDYFFKPEPLNSILLTSWPNNLFLIDNLKRLINN